MRFGYGTLFTDAVARAQSVIDALWRDPPHPPHLVHGDLTPANVIAAPHVGLVPIDFQDTVLGLEVQDLAITVAALRRRPDGDRLADAFRAGYAGCRPWPDVSPDLFDSLVAGRWLHQLNLTLNVTDAGELDGYVAGHAERTRAWLRRPRPSRLVQPSVAGRIAQRFRTARSRQQVTSGSGTGSGAPSRSIRRCHNSSHVCAGAGRAQPREAGS